MPGVGAALGDNRNLHAGGVVEVGSLVGGGDLELLDAVHRGGHHTGRLTAGKAEIAPADLILRVGKQTAGRIIAEARIVNSTAAVHIIAVIAAVKHEVGLVHDRATHTAIRANSRLHSYERTDIAAKTRKRLQHVAAYSVTDSRIQRLQLSI